MAKLNLNKRAPCGLYILHINSPIICLLEFFSFCSGRIVSHNEITLQHSYSYLEYIFKWIFFIFCHLNSSYLFAKVLAHSNTSRFHFYFDQNIYIYLISDQIAKMLNNRIIPNFSGKPFKSMQWHSTNWMAYRQIRKTMRSLSTVAYYLFSDEMRYSVDP